MNVFIALKGTHLWFLLHLVKLCVFYNLRHFVDILFEITFDLILTRELIISLNDLPWTFQRHSSSFDYLNQIIIEPPHDKTNKMACASSEDSDQPGHPPSLIRVFAVRMKRHWVISYPLSALLRLIRLGGCPVRWAQRSFCRFCHAAANKIICHMWRYSRTRNIQNTKIKRYCLSVSFSLWFIQCLRDS